MHGISFAAGAPPQTPLVEEGGGTHIALPAPSVIREGEGEVRFEASGPGGTMVRPWLHQDGH